MRTRLCLVTIAFALCCAAPAPAVQIDPSGVSSDIDPAAAAPRTASVAARALCYFLGGENLETLRFASLGLQVTVVNGEPGFAAANLSNYDIIIISSVCGGHLASQQTRITNFVAAGGGLLVHQPNCPGTLAFLPPGFEISIRDYFWCGFPNAFPAHLTGAPHPVVAGLTDLQLSGTFDWVAGLGPGFTVLATNPGLGCGDPGLAAGNYGLGRVAFEDGNASSNSSWSGADAYWIQLFTWLVAGSPVPARRSSWGELKTLYR
jgi:hypothetical protein